MPGFTCNLCEAMCGLDVTVEDGRVTRIAGDHDDPLSRGHLCPKAIGLGELLDDPDRLRHPVRRTAAGWERLAWPAALDLAAARLRAVRDAHGPDAVALYVGNPVVHSHRAALAAELLTLAVGSRNRFDPNSQDSNPRLHACMQVHGDALAMAVPDVDRCDLLIMLGANPAASNGSQVGLGDARARFRALRERGGRLVLVDPRRSETAAWATEHHFIRPGGDAALLLAMLHVLFAEGRVDLARLARTTTGHDELRDLAARFSPARVAPAIGVDARTIARLARDLAATPRACVYARVGVCQNELGPIAMWLVEALNVVTGHLDREGGAMFPTPAADIAGLGRLVVGNHAGRWRSRVRGLPELLGALPSAVMAEEMETPGPGRIRALVVLAGNPVLSTPDGPRLARALAGLEAMVAIDYYVNETTRHADVVLPPRHVFETGNYDVLLARFAVRNVARYSPPILATGDDTLDDWTIATELALRLRGLDGPVVGRALRRLARDLPERVLDLLLRTGPYRLSLAALRAAPHGLDLGPLVPSGGRAIRTPGHRPRLAPPELVAGVAQVDAWLARPPAPLVLIGRRHLRSNNSWMHNLPSCAKGPDRSRAQLHPDDAARAGVADGEVARLASRTGAVEVAVEVTADVMPGVVSLPHGFGHQPAAGTLRRAGALPGVNANALTDPMLVEPLLGTSILNGVPITVEPRPAPGREDEP
ncbi:MAG TPA: molybdopterin-dependent oxidoreductase [Kofleriaceae bacterium]|nr:molybdopterin-dependent oxidoreductase [Kofleriaceae bacterium]